MDLPLTLIALTIVWLGYMEMPKETLFPFLIIVVFVWWVRGSIEY